MVLLPFLIPDKFLNPQFAADPMKFLTGKQSEVLATVPLRYSVKTLILFKPVSQEAFERLHLIRFLPIAFKKCGTCSSTASAIR